MLSPKPVKFLKFAAVLGVVPAILYAHEYGPSAYFTAAPGDNPPNACAKSNCHSSPVNSVSYGGSVAIQMPSGATTYTPGGPAQLITVLISDANRTSWGFQITARAASSPTTTQAGNFTDVNGNTQGNNSSPVQVICFTGNYAPCPTSNPLQWSEHTLAGWAAGVNHPKSYSFQTLWTPPATNIGNVTLYAAGNASSSTTPNAPNVSTGHIYTSNITLSPASGTAPAPVPAISSGGIVSAGNFGAFTSAAPGSWIEIYGTNLAASSYTWQGSDFVGSAAPTTINGVKVSVGGQPAYVSYVSAGQIDAQIPANVGSGPQPVVVTNASGSSSAYMLTINALQPGLLAPPSFAVSGKQYAAFFHSNLTTFVLPPGAIAGVSSAYATPGEIIITYGVGFGAVTPSSASDAGQIVSGTSQLPNFSITMGGMTAVPAYYGLAPGFVGLYQFNVPVPQIANSDLVPVTFKVNGTAGTQTLYTAVHN